MPRPKRCRICRRALPSINGKGHCASCATNKVIAVIKSLRQRKGKYYKKWKHNLLESLKRR